MTLVFVSPRLTSAALQQLYDEPAYFEGGVYGGAVGRWSPAMVLQRTWTAGRLAEIARLRPPPARCWRSAAATGCSWPRPGMPGTTCAASSSPAPAPSTPGRSSAWTCSAGNWRMRPTEPADVICFWDTLEHVPDPLAFLREVGRRLAPDGVFALSVPYFSSVPARVLGSRWWTLKPEQHIWHFTPATLRLVAARAGLVITSVITSPLRRANVGRTDSLVAFGRAIPGRRVMTSARETDRCTARRPRSSTT